MPFGTKTCEDDEGNLEGKVQCEYGGSQEQDERDIFLHNSDTEAQDPLEGIIVEVESISEDEIETSGSERHSSDSGTDGDVEGDGGDDDDNEETNNDQSDMMVLCEVWGFVELLVAGRIYAVLVQEDIYYINYNSQECKCPFFSSNIVHCI